MPAENTENHAGEPATNTSNPTDNNPTNPSNSTDNPADEAADDPAGNPTEKPTGNPTDNPPGNPGGDPAANLGEPPSEPAEATPAPSAESPPTELPPAESPPPEPPPAPKPVRAAKAPPTQTKPKQKINRREQKKKRIEQQRIKAYLDYFDFSEEVKKIPPHRVLAINRGERAKVLRVKIELDVEAMYQVLDEMLVPADHPHADYLRGCARDALNRLILPSLEREIRRELTDRAEAHAVGVFAKNLRNLLLQPPVHDRRVLAVDPGYKSGCKLAALDQFGNMLEKGVIYLIGKPERREQARRKVIELIDRFQLSVVAIGNGTACRECEDFFSELVADQLKDRNVAYVIVNEAGASVYSTSHVGREEFPGYDASLRGAISIGRRLQDPLSELVKIDAANIGVGLYQHDVKAKHLRTSLDEVVESCVNYVGVDVNTASPSLLRYVSGLNQLTARRVYERRHQLGPFRSRQQLREVPGFGEATFVQAVGFLKIASGENPLDATWIHPESYDATQRLLAKLGRTPADLSNKEATADLAKQVAEVDLDEMAKELEIGVLTLKDILAQFARPGRDPREDLPAPVFKQGVLKLEDLEPGMELTGTVLNVVDFGAFVDIGMHDSGLVHVSQLADRFIRDPHDLVAVGDIVKVWVLEVDKQRRRVSLTMIQPGSERPRRQHRDEKAGDGKGRAEGRSDRGGPRGEKSRAAGESRRPRPKGPSQGRTAPGGRRPPRGKGPPRPTYRPKAPPKPIVPITDAMKTGKEPMRTFGDLAQFFQNQQHDDEPNSRQAKKKQPKKPKAKPEPQETKTPEQVESSPEVKTPEEVGTPQEVETPQETPPQATVAEQAQLPASADGPPVEAPPQAAEAKQHAVPESGPKEMAQIPPAGPPAEGPDDAAASPPPPQQTPPPGEQGRQDDQP
ncbi:MAG: helix-hairpin-helix domain-containing protein [Pirellulales bacterium]|nr:helix-hairpin-helix domain-containing protein [Pirellulales bacterium]